MRVSAGDYVTTMPRDDQDRKGKIRTYTGRYVDPLNLQPDDVNILDIAHHLSNLCRYTGACPEFYSVAQHSVYVSSLMYEMHGTAEAAMAGLLHDAAEAYFNDLASPVKKDPRMQWYRDLEHGATELIFKRYSVDPGWLPIVKACDDKAFRDEVATWWNGTTHIVPLQPKPAEMFFLNEFHSLQKRMGA